MKLSRYNRSHLPDFSDFDRWFDHAFNAFRRAPFAGLHTPALDVDENAEAYEITLELPGVKKEDLQIEYANRQLTVSAQRQEGEESRIELKRTVRLPAEIEHGNISARLEDGILQIHVPKAEEAKPRQIEIK